MCSRTPLALVSSIARLRLMRAWGSWGLSFTALRAERRAAWGWLSSSCSQARQVHPAESRGSCWVMVRKLSITSGSGAPSW